MEESFIVSNVVFAVKSLYNKDQPLMERDLCERCLVHRLAVYLERLFLGFKVDCEFNKEFDDEKVGNKILTNQNGNYVDILIHKRSNIMGDNLVCIEVKKEKNYVERYKDRRNLEILTGNRFCYILGFYIILGKSYEKTKMEVYKNGGIIKKLSLY